MGKHDEAEREAGARSGSESSEPVAEARRVPDEVFPAAFLAWTDEESGEELQIALYGPADLVDSLLDAGFVRRLATSADGAAPAVRIRATPCP